VTTNLHPYRLARFAVTWAEWCNGKPHMPPMGMCRAKKHSFAAANTNGASPAQQELQCMV